MISSRPATTACLGLGYQDPLPLPWPFLGPIYKVYSDVLTCHWGLHLAFSCPGQPGECTVQRPLRSVEKAASAQRCANSLLADVRDFGAWLSNNKEPTYKPDYPAGREPDQAGRGPAARACCCWSSVCRIPWRSSTLVTTPSWWSKVVSRAEQICAVMLDVSRQMQ